MMRLGRLMSVIGILLVLSTAQWLVAVEPPTATASIDPTCKAYPPYPDGIYCDQVMPGAQVDYFKLFYPNGCFVKLTNVEVLSQPAGIKGTVAVSDCAPFPVRASVLVTFLPHLQIFVTPPSESTNVPVVPTPTAASVAELTRR